MKVLVINAGSSSLKYQLIDMDNEGVLCKGIVEKITMPDSEMVYKVEGKPNYKVEKAVANHIEALELVMEAMTSKEHGVIGSVDEIGAVGHRVLHSGVDFNDSVLITDEVLVKCDKNAVLGPLHQIANLSCVRACQQLMPKTPMVAVFDTVFHSTMPDYAYMYAIPYSDYEDYKIRKYGFHGTSHKFVTDAITKYLGTEKSKIITCHLGNGSSLAAVLDGKCIDTTMGLTPLEGVIMGTRSGDLDPAVVEFMAKMKGISVSEVLNILNKKSGLLGIAGVSDFRQLNEKIVEGDERAKLAMNMFGYRVKKYIGSYIAALGGLDCLVFTGGIGENSHKGREAVFKGLECFGIEVDLDKNRNVRGEFGVISKDTSKVKVIIQPTNEELVIARDAVRLTK